MKLQYTLCLGTWTAYLAHSVKIFITHLRIVTWPLETPWVCQVSHTHSHFKAARRHDQLPQILERLSRHMLSFLLYSLFKSKVKHLHSYLNTFLTSYADFSYHIASSASARLGHSVFFWHSEHRWQNSRANYTKNCLLCFHWSLFTTAKFKADVSHFKCMFHKLPPSHILQFLTTDLHGTEVRKWHQLALFSLQIQEVGERQ